MLPTSAALKYLQLLTSLDSSIASKINLMIIYSIKDKFAAGYVGDKWIKTNGEYTIQSGYRWLSGNGNQWPWWRDIWNTMNVPKHSFICCLTMHMRLLTRDRLAKMGICEETECLLCGCKPESIGTSLL